MEYQITQFNGGFSRDERSKNTNQCEYSKDFDIFAKTHSLIPNKLTATLGAGSSAGVLRRVTRGLDSDVVWGLFNYNSGTPRIYSSTSITASWGGSYVEGNSGFYDQLFTYYHPTASVYFLNRASGPGNTYLYRNPVGGGGIASVGDIGSVITTACEAYINPNDGKMYFGTDNKLHRVDAAGTLSTDILAASLPSNLYITNITSDGVYLLVSCASNRGHSYTYLVDTDLTTPAVIDVIDFGEGILASCGVVGGTVFGVSYEYTETLDHERVTVRYWSGGDKAVLFKEFFATIDNNAVVKKTLAKEDRMYFAMNMVDDISGQTLSGIWAIGKNGDNFAITLDNTDSNLGAYNIEQFDILGDYRYFMTSEDVCHRTPNSTAAADFSTAIYVTPKISSNRIGRKLQLKNVAMRTKPLAADQIANLYYSVDGGAFTQILNETDDTTVVARDEHDNAGDRFAEGYEYQFKLESDGGAEITGFYANFEEDNE